VSASLKHFGDERCPHCGSAAQWTKPRILDGLSRWVGEHDRVPTQDDWHYAKPWHPSEGTVRKKFGSWNAMLVAAGYPPNQRGGRPRGFTRTEITVAVTAWKMQYGRLPKQRDWRGQVPGFPTRQQVVTEFGSWNAALVAAGYETHELNKSYRSTRGYQTLGRERDALGRLRPA